MKHSTIYHSQRFNVNETVTTIDRTSWRGTLAISTSTLFFAIPLHKKCPRIYIYELLMKLQITRTLAQECTPRRGIQIRSIFQPVSYPWKNSLSKKKWLAESRYVIWFKISTTTSGKGGGRKYSTNIPDSHALLRRRYRRRVPEIESNEPGNLVYSQEYVNSDTTGRKIALALLFRSFSFSPFSHFSTSRYEPILPLGSVINNLRVYHDAVSATVRLYAIEPSK